MGDNGYFNLSDFDGDWDAGETRVVAELTESSFDDTTQESRVFSGSFYSWDTDGEDVAILVNTGFDDCVFLWRTPPIEAT